MRDWIDAYVYNMTFQTKSFCFFFFFFFLKKKQLFYTYINLICSSSSNSFGTVISKQVLGDLFNTISNTEIKNHTQCQLVAELKEPNS
jgi:hypothetical protein